GHPQRLRGGIVDASFMADVREPAAAQVVEELRGGPLVGLRGAVRLRNPVERAPEIALGSPLHVVGDEEVELAVAVVVDPGGAGAEAGVPDAGGGGDVPELAAALVVEEMVAVERGDVDVLAAVV